ncbi:Crp/Fnr family transcriptional regulator [Sphingobacterium sp.]|uniref:Crp/Fnr family transcriptional regulator n=1 Tax=Sphingobacterium sp. TaxID=341027 RepID=UPI0028A97481|nr:Crp/Fnr family transcriptional regulator [Sphingobacterium sp.]
MIPSELLIEKGATVKKVESAEVIFHENSPSNFYYQVISGRVIICNFLADGKEVLHKVVCAGEGFGEVAILDNGFHVATAIADKPCTMLKLSSSAFMEILSDYHSIMLLVTQRIARELRFKLFMTKMICSYSPEEILIHLLNKLNDENKLICGECHRLMLTRQQLANMTGLRVETIIRAMKNLEKEEKLSIIKGKVFIPTYCTGKVEG